MNERIQKSYDSYYLRINEINERIQKSYDQLSKNFDALGMPKVTSLENNLFNASKRYQDLIKNITPTNHIATMFADMHQSWLVNPIESLPPESIQSSIFAKLSLMDTSLRLSSTEHFMRDIDFDSIMESFKIEKPLISSLESSIAGATASYGGLAMSFEGISDIVRLPSFVLPGATREIYTTSLALDALHSRDEEETETNIQLITEVEGETSDCINLLKQVDPNLVSPYNGARTTLESDSSDKARQVLVSLRGMWEALLKRLAPDALVRTWIAGTPNPQDLLHNKNPTRRAALLYIFRDLNSDPLTEFLVQDTVAFLRLYDLFNRIHELEIKLTDEQLKAICLKSDSWLMYILQIHMSSFSK